MSPKNDKKPRLAILVSGGGRSLANLAEKIEAGDLDCELALVLSDKQGTVALERADKLGIETVVLSRKSFDSHESFGDAVFAEIEQRECDLVVLAGFLRLLPIPAAWSGKVLNIHPSLLPDFGGKGFYGDHVHRAVLESGAQVTGCTVHYVTNEYDSGPILLQRSIEVRAGESVEELGSRVFEEEKIALPEAIRLHLGRR